MLKIIVNVEFYTIFRTHESLGKINEIRTQTYLSFCVEDENKLKTK